MKNIFMTYLIEGDNIMIPWDFGLINTLKNLLDISIFPSEPPEEQRKTPYIILELLNIEQNINLVTKLGLKLTIVYNQEQMPAYYSIIKTMKKAIAQKLTLKQGNFEIGTAQIKLEKFVTKKNNLILDLTALLYLKAIYDDIEEIQDE